MAADQLAKSFDQHLDEIVGNDRVIRRSLLQRGWKEFVDKEYPDTNSAPLMAARAICYIGLDGNGHWCNDSQLIIAAVSFLSTHGMGGPQRPVGELGGILRNPPVDSDAVVRWFMLAYPQH